MEPWIWGERQGRGQAGVRRQQAWDREGAGAGRRGQHESDRTGSADGWGGRWTLVPRCTRQEGTQENGSHSEPRRRRANQGTVLEGGAALQLTGTRRTVLGSPAGRGREAAAVRDYLALVGVAVFPHDALVVADVLEGLAGEAPARSTDTPPVLARVVAAAGAGGLDRGRTPQTRERHWSFRKAAWTRPATGIHHHWAPTSRPSTDMPADPSRPPCGADAVISWGSKRLKDLPRATQQTAADCSRAAGQGSGGAGLWLDRMGAICGQERVSGLPPQGRTLGSHDC